MPVTFPFTLTNGTPADAAQVMADLNAIVAAMDATAPRFQTHATDANVTLTTVAPFETVQSTATFTSTRTATLSTVGAVAGRRFRIVRTGVTPVANQLNVGGLKSLVQNTWCDVTYNGSAWVLTAYGAL